MGNDLKPLMTAVLEDGIRNYCGRIGWRRAEAEAWIRSNRRTPFSFVVVCEALGLEPDAVRRALPRLRQQPSRRRLRRNGRRQLLLAK
jgi:hypothetical protein